MASLSKKIDEICKSFNYVRIKLSISISAFVSAKLAIIESFWECPSTVLYF